MAFKNPSSGGDIPYIDEGRYVAKCIRLDERLGTIDYGNGLQPQVVWVFLLQRQDGTVVLDPRGLPQEWWVFTSQSLGEKSAARPMAEALLARSVAEMTGEQVAEAVVGCKCSVLIADQYSQDGQTVRSKAVIGSWKPLQAEAATAPAAGKTVGKPAPVQPQEPVQEEVPF